MAAIDDLMQKLSDTAAITKQLDEVRGKLQGYRDVRQQYADLVASTITERDALVAASETALRGLADAIDAAFP